LAGPTNDHHARKLNETAATVMRILVNAVTTYTQLNATKHRWAPARGIFWASLFSLLTWVGSFTPRGGYLG
jgi:hypothetical protein